jgi:SAM-dependent methyltransferase
LDSRHECELDIECPACNVCGSRQARRLFDGRDRQHGLPGIFGVVRCDGCGLIYLSPRPTPATIGRYYPVDYGPHTAPVQAARRRISRWDARYGLYKQLRAISRFEPGGRLLDVGCGTGDMLAFAREHGWEVAGVEPVVTAAAYCRDVLGLPVRTGDLEAAAFPDAYFDVVSLWNVFEHLYDPAGTLLELRRVLRPGGLLVLAVPNPASVDARLFGPAWIGYEVPRHLYTFPPAVLDRMLAGAGFQVVRRACLSSSYHVFFLSVLFWLQDRPRLRRAVPWVRRAQVSRLLRLLAAPYFWAVDRAARGPVVTVLARREDRP